MQSIWNLDSASLKCSAESGLDANCLPIVRDSSYKITIPKMLYRYPGQERRSDTLLGCHITLQFKATLKDLQSFWWTIHKCG
jgi:hypothetical protein